MIYETIVTTCSAQGEVHIAPFGVQWSDGKVVIAPYKPSATLQNILETGRAVLNLTDDVRIFAAAIAKRTPFATQEVAHGCVRLENCLTHHILKLDQVEEDAVRPRLTMTVEESVLHGPFMGFNRAQAAVIELAVLVSRLHMLPIEKINQEMEYLKIAIDKTAGERELEAWQWLVDTINNHIARESGLQQA
ncbi:MAG: DUF447 domain-containing protein [Methylophilus sp.]|uniref:DUF447 domain-containing protein n=1 Tax=Methylophilus sp. TaxID=29541 RepID=UPI002C229959|nr:DUF447 domain-containing protein [Methylophilus sp.]HSH87437.1 DUF447 domain-containing protein [Methylophilus sp.]